MPDPTMSSAERELQQLLNLSQHHENNVIFAAKKQRALPVVIVTGFLGSGKTTLIKHLFRRKLNLKLACFVHEACAVNIDAHVIAGAKEEKQGNAASSFVFKDKGGAAKGFFANSINSNKSDPNSTKVLPSYGEISNFGFVGPLRGALGTTLACCANDHELDAQFDLYEQDIDSGIKACLTEGVDNGVLDYCLIETSGSENPERIIKRVERSFGATYRARLDLVVCVIDATNVFDMSKNQRAFLDRQLSYADIVILNKTDILISENLSCVPIEQETNDFQNDDISAIPQNINVQDDPVIKDILTHINWTGPHIIAESFFSNVGIAMVLDVHVAENKASLGASHEQTDTLIVSRPYVDESKEGRKIEEALYRKQEERTDLQEKLNDEEEEEKEKSNLSKDNQLGLTTFDCEEWEMPCPELGSVLTFFENLPKGFGNDLWRGKAVVWVKVPRSAIYSNNATPNDENFIDNNLISARLQWNLWGAGRMSLDLDSWPTGLTPYTKVALIGGVGMQKDIGDSDTFIRNSLFAVSASNSGSRRHSLSNGHNLFASGILENVELPGLNSNSTSNNPKSTLSAFRIRPHLTYGAKAHPDENAFLAAVKKDANFIISLHKKVADNMNRTKVNLDISQDVLNEKALILAVNDTIIWTRGGPGNLDFLEAVIRNVCNYELRHVLSSCMCGQ